MTKIYIAGPMFSEAEKAYNKVITSLLEGSGYEVFLPQRDVKDVQELLDEGMNWDQVNQHIFDEDTKGIKGCDIVLLVMDGRVPDDGACVEIGYAHALGKECVGLKTDLRTFMGEYDNSMIVGALRNRIARSTTELIGVLHTLG